jgi:hypothetical protein
MSYESRHGSILKRNIAEHRQKLLEDLGMSCAKDYGEYKQIVGRIQGLDEALGLSEAADREINGGS